MKKLLLLVFSIVVFLSGKSQCLQVLDGNGNFTDTPQFVQCTPGGFTVFIQPDRNMGNYTIDWGDGSANSTGASLLTNQSVSHLYPVGTANYTLTITDNSTGCTIMGMVVLERNPLASIQLPAGDDNFGCTPVQFRFINSSTQISSNTNFVWDFGDGSPVQNFNFTNLGDTVLHTYLPGVGVQSCELNVTLTATNFCGASTASFFPLRVWDLDEAQITPSATLLCYPDTVVQYVNSTIRNCFPEGNQSQRFERWNFGDYWGLGRDSIIDWRPWNPPIINPPPIAYPGIGVYTVTLQDSSFCGIDDVTIAIEIRNPPVAVLSSNKDTICEGENVTFINGTVGANRFRWNFDQGSGFQNLNGNNKTRTYNNAGDYTIQLVTDINGAQGCTDTASVELHVLPSPDADFSFTPNNECDSMTVNFTSTSTGAIVSYNWDFDNGNTFTGLTPPSQFYPSPGTYTVTLTVANSRGCSDTRTRDVTVNASPSAGFTVASVCLNEQANFMDQSNGNGTTITSYQWDFGDGSTSTQQNPSHLYTTFGNFQVEQIVSNGFCNDTSIVMVTVENRPTADFTVTPDSGCSRLTVNVTNQSSANAVSFRWNFGDGSPEVMATDTSHTYTNNGITDTTFIIQLIATSAFGCTDTITDSVQVFPVPIPSFTSDAVVDCGPVTVNFTNTTPGSNLSFQWNFGDGSPISTVVNPTHVFQNQTLFINNYQVQLVVTSANGCTDTTMQVVQVFPEPIFTFSVVPDSGCSPLSVMFPSVVGAVDYQWDFGDGATASGPTPTHVYVNNTTNNQNFTVRLVAQSSFGCRDTTFGTVVVFPNPTASFALDTNVGCQPLPISVTNNSTGGNQFLWDFGDGTTSDTMDASFVKTYTNPSSLTAFNTIQLITETVNGCRDTATQVVEVHPFIQAAFASDSVGCSPLSIPFNNQSFGGQNFQWFFGDGGSSQIASPNYTYNNTTNSNQNYLARLIAISAKGCLDSAERNILVYPKPTASYTVDVNSGCQPLEVTFTNLSSLADSCAWQYGDQDTFNLCSPTNMHTYTNTTSLFPINYISQLRVFSINGCEDTLERTITVNPEVVADFTSDTAGCSPLPVNFLNQSSGAQSFIWSFGNGGNDFTTNPSTVYTNTGLQDQLFTVQLIAASQFGCNDTITRDIEVYAKPVANYAADVVLGCSPFPVTFTNNSSIADSCRWDFGDGSAVIDSCFTSNVHTYSNTFSSVPITRVAELIVYTDNGCSDTLRRNIRVNPAIQASFNSDTIGCSPLQIDFTNQSTGAQIYQWSFGDGALSPQVNPSHTYINLSQNTEIRTAQLIATSNFGCADTVDQRITVFPKPTADYTIDVNGGCQPLEVNFSNNSTLRDSCIWTFGDGNDSSDCSPQITHTYFNTQSIVPVGFVSELVIQTDNGCSDTLSRIITVNPQVIADFTSDSIACSPLDATFRSQSFGATTYSWDFGDGSTGAGMVTTHQYTNTGAVDSIFTARLIASSQFNCDDTIEKIITVRPTPIVNFTATPQNQEFPNATVSVTNLTNAGNWNFDWDFDDGFTSNDRNPTPHTYTTWGDYDIRLTASSAFCEDSANTIITIESPTPIADFGDSATGCEPLEVAFTNRSQFGNTYEWDFGDGGTSNSENPTHIYFEEGLYTVRLRVTGFTQTKTDEIIKTDYIQVFKTPRADFITNRDMVFIPNDPVVFSNRSVDADSFMWDFGDGNTSTDRSPTYNYTTEGEFQVSLIAMTNEGCADTAFAPNLILAELEGRITVPNAFTPNPRGSNGGVVNINPGAGEFNDVFYAKVLGSVKYELNIFNKWGELLFVSKDINIGWDGYYKGELAQQDAYVWKVKVEFADGTSEVRVGDLMLLR